MDAKQAGVRNGRNLYIRKHKALIASRGVHQISRRKKTNLCF